MPGVQVFVKCNSAGLIGQTELRLDPVCDPLPLLPRQLFPVRVPDLNVKERLHALRQRFGHDMDGPEGFPEIVGCKTPHVPERRPLVVLGGGHVVRKLRAVVMCGALGDHTVRSLRPTISRIRPTAARVSVSAARASLLPTTWDELRVLAI